ncbi:PorV/PorQ family protein [Halalkalibaculum sp. DA3122]|uniref:PorV/PorQ family protein n=1 Tax=Halalkalibaculum sp. DA3122 TaxID=3373607 RepID=UPI0037548824
MKYKKAHNRCGPGTSCCWLPVLVFGFIVIPSCLWAQAGGLAGSFSRLGFGPRGMSMGNAMSSTPGDGFYSYYNPAHAARNINGRQLDVSTSLMKFDRTLHQLNGALPLPPKAGISFSILNAGVDNIDGRTRSGYHTQMLSTNEYQFASAFGIRLTPRWNLGVGIKLYLADFHAALQNVTSFGFDLGTLYKVSPTLTLGLVIQDLLAEYPWNTGTLYGDSSSGTNVDEFPTQLRIGASYQLFQNLLVALDPGLLLEPSPGSDPIFQLRAGGRYRIHEQVSLRAGWQVGNLRSIATSNNFSAGFSVHLPFDLLAPSVDYAFVPEPNYVSTMHIFGLQLNL